MTRQQKGKQDPSAINPLVNQTLKLFDSIHAKAQAIVDHPLPEYRVAIDNILNYLLILGEDHDHALATGNTSELHEIRREFLDSIEQLRQLFNGVDEPPHADPPAEPEEPIYPPVDFFEDLERRTNRDPFIGESFAGANYLQPSGLPPHEASVPQRPAEETIVQAVARDAYLMTGSSLIFQELQRVISHGATAWKEDGRWPTASLDTRKKTLRGYVQLSPDPDTIEPFLTEDELASRRQEMRRRISEMGDLTADVMDILVAIWLRRASHPDEMVIVTSDDFLTIRKLKKHAGGTGRPGGYANERRHEIARHMGLLANCHITIQQAAAPEPTTTRRGRKSAEYSGRSAAIVVSSSFGQVSIGNTTEAFAWRLRPGDVLARFLFGPGRQTALLSNQAVRYDPYRQRWEKRLTREFATQWRIRQNGGGYLDPITIRTLLENIGETPASGRPGRTRERFEQALDQLKQDGVIAGWHYLRDTHLPARDWLDHWLGWLVQVEPPAAIQDFYAGALPPPARTGPTLPAPLMPFAERVRQRRDIEGLTQLAAAERIGISNSRLSRIERGGAPTKNEAAILERWLNG